MSVHQADSRTFDSTAPPIQGNTKSRKSSYALLTIGIISMAIGIIGILAHQGVFGKKVLDSLKKIPNSIGGEDLVLGVGIVLVGLPPTVLLICIAKSKGDVNSIHESEKIEHVGDARTIETNVTKNYLVYGQEAWSDLGVKILDTVPQCPFNLSELREKKRVALFIPNRILINSIEQDLTLITLMKIDKRLTFFKQIENEIGANPGSARWIQIDKEVIYETRGYIENNYEKQKQIVEAIGCQMPTALEVIVRNLMVPYEELESTCLYILCTEIIKGEQEGRPYYVLVSNGPSGTSVCSTYEKWSPNWGTVGVQRF